MDITTAIALAASLAIVSIIAAAFCQFEGKPSLGNAYTLFGSAPKYWAALLGGFVVNAAAFYYSPMWLTIIFVVIAIAGLGHNLWWAAQIRASNRAAPRVFTHADEEAMARRDG